MDMRSPVKKEKQSKNKDSDVVLTNLLSSDLDSLSRLERVFDISYMHRIYYELELFSFVEYFIIVLVWHLKVVQVILLISLRRIDLLINLIS